MGFSVPFISLEQEEYLKLCDGDPLKDLQYNLLVTFVSPDVRKRALGVKAT